MYNPRVRSLIDSLCLGSLLDEDLWICLLEVRQEVHSDLFMVVVRENSRILQLCGGKHRKIIIGSLDRPVVSNSDGDFPTDA